MNISDINKDINLATYCHENTVLPLPATEKGVCTSNRKDATHNINQKLQELKINRVEKRKLLSQVGN